MIVVTRDEKKEVIKWVGKEADIRKASKDELEFLLDHELWFNALTQGKCSYPIQTSFGSVSY